MDPESNILVRRCLAAALFFFGLGWAILTVRGFREAPPALFAFLAIGSLIWISWGFIAFSGIRRKREVLGWSVSAIYHGAILVTVIPAIGTPWHFSTISVIPIWWAIAFVFSITGVWLALKNEEERA